MRLKTGFLLLGLVLMLTACNVPPIPTATPHSLPSNTATEPLPPTETPLPPPTETATFTLQPSATFTPLAPSPTFTPIPPTATMEADKPFRLVSNIAPEMFIESLWNPVRFGPALEGDDLLLKTSTGFARISERGITIFLASEEQTVVGFDDQGTMWFFREKDGSVIYSWDGEGDWVPHTEGWKEIMYPSNLKGRGVVTDHKGHLWLATAQDVRRFNGQRWKIWTREELGMATPELDEFMIPMKVYIFDNPKQIWVTSCDFGGPGPMGGGGARWLGEDTWLGQDTPAKEGCVHTLHKEANGAIWMGVENTLWRIRPDEAIWEEHSFLPLGGKINFAYAANIVVSPRDGEPWVSFLLCGGASCDSYMRYRFQNGEWVESGPLTYVPDQVIFSSDGIAWQLDLVSMNRFDGEQFVPVADLYPLAGAIDQQGRMWIIGSPPDQASEVWLYVP